MKTIKELEKEIEEINKARKEVESGLLSELQEKGRKLRDLQKKYGHKDFLKSELKTKKEICKMIEEIDKARIWNQNDGLKELLGRLTGGKGNGK